MIIIEYHRFILEPETDKALPGFNNQIHKITYHQIIDHTDVRSEEQCPLERAKRSAKEFLNNHYGYVLIRISNQGENDRDIVIKLCNHKKFWKDMLSNGVLVEKGKKG